MTIRTIICDVMDGLAQLADESVHCVVTSPPYWGLRDYGVEGQIGLEDTPEAYVAKMVEVFREVRRVLRPDGTCWLNLGDSYASSPPGNKTKGVSAKSTLHGVNSDQYRDTLSKSVQTKRNTIVGGLKPKDLIGIPWRVAFALQADGWWLRSDIIWSKPNPMPESVTDRPTKAHEYVFLLTKSPRYFYDAEAIREPLKEGADHDRPRAYVDGERGVSSKGNTLPTTEGRLKPMQSNPSGRNKRTVWTIATAPYSEAHFATFPPELPELCIKAGCPKGGTVLDPFGGAGTTGLVADRLQRNAILIELNPEYATMSEARVDKDRGGLLDMMEEEAL